MQVTFIDDLESWSRMLPLTYTRPVADVRVGILKIHEKWERLLSIEKTTFISKDYLEAKFNKPTSKGLFIKGGLLPSPKLVEAIKSLNEDQVLVNEEMVIAGYFSLDENFEKGSRDIIQLGDVHFIEYPWDIFRLNSDEIKNDFELLCTNRSSEKLDDPHTKTYGNQIFLEKGAKVKAAVLNAENGPIYIGKNSEVQEGSLIRGPFVLCDHSIVNMGTKIKGNTTIGPHSKVGGEISNSIIQGYSNKGHDGFLGNAVIGEWCNLGADTNNSNMKNNYANVKMWDFDSSRFKDTGLQFCGLIMGDHSKCGINTMFNTGTTIGISSNIFGDGFPRNFIPSFSWGGAAGFFTYPLNKVFETARLAMKRRNVELTPADESILSSIFEYTSAFRVWEKK
jgi:UDP-N-acetylglucosamine diphosphorylase/glucosamine-1-phosphate N-acetyltransferase